MAPETAGRKEETVGATADRSGGPDPDSAGGGMDHASADPSRPAIPIGEIISRPAFVPLSFLLPAAGAIFR